MNGAGVENVYLRLYTRAHVLIKFAVAVVELGRGDFAFFPFEFALASRDTDFVLGN